MAWGTGPWGETPWGTGLDLPPPVLLAVSPSILAEQGGTVIKIIGENFFAPVTVDVLDGGVVVARGFVFDDEFDVEENRIFACMPARPTGLWDLRVTTPGGSSGVLADALDYRYFADESKVQRVRMGFAAPWRTGPRLFVDSLIGI